MGGTWHLKQNPDERQKIIQIVVATLKDIQGVDFNEATAIKQAHDFEKYMFMKCTSRDEYLNQIKQKVHQMRGSLRNNSGPGMQQPQNPQNAQNVQNQQFLAHARQAQAHQQQQQQQQHQQQQIPGQQNIGLGLGTDAPNQGMNFFPQNQMQMRNGMMPQLLPQQGHQQVPQAQMNRAAPQQQMPQQQQQQQQHQQQQNSLSGPQQGSGPQGINRNIGNQLTPQQIQQLSAMIKNVPIPPVFLNKIPNLPPNVNTWARIYDLAQKKVIPLSSLPAIKEVHNAHLLIVMHQQLQRLAQRRMSNMNGGPGSGGAMASTSSNDQNININSLNNTNTGMNNMNNMNNMDKLSRPSTGQMNMQNQQMQQQQAAFKNNSNKNDQYTMLNSMGMQRPQLRQSQTTPMMKQQQMSNQSNLNIAGPNPGNQQQQQTLGKMPNFQITPQDMMEYQAQALAYLSRAQQDGKIPPNLDNNAKQNFIRKYIYHQKATAWRNEQLKAAQSKGNGSAQLNVGPQRTPQQLLMGQGGFPSQPLQQQNQPQQQVMGGLQSMGQPQQSPMMGNMQQPNAASMMNQGNNQPLFSPVMQQKFPMQGQQVNLGNVNAPLNQIRRPQGVPPITDEMKMKLRSLFDEVARGDSFQLKNHTTSLSDQDKLRMKDLMVKINQQYANVDSVLSYYYVLTSDIGGTKKLIQMKFMSRNIIESYQKGIYLANPEILEKLIVHFQRYFDVVKKELTARRQQQQQQQQQQQPQKIDSTQPQMSAAQQRPAMNQPTAQMTGQRPMQPLPQGDQRFMPQNASQGAQNYMPSGMGQLPNMASQLQAQQVPPVPPQQQLQPQQQLSNQRSMGVQQPSQQQFTRNATYGQISQNQPDWLKAVNPEQRGAQPSPQMQSQPVPKNTAKGKKASTSGTAGRRKSTKASGTMPTPGNSAPTPATLANAIKTPNSMPTPQVIQSNSNKGTPIDVSPNSDNKGANVTSKEPIVGEVFGANKVDSKLDSRRELSKTDPEQFFFAALSNLLEVDKADSTNGTKGGSAGTDHTKSPLSPNSAEWTCAVKPEAIKSAFCQVDCIKELTAMEILEECAKMVDRDAKKREEVNSRKREREEPDDIDILFNDTDAKKIKSEDFDRFMFEPVEFDEWKNWLTGLQQAKV